MKKLLLAFSLLVLSSSLLFAQPWGQLLQGEITMGTAGNEMANAMVKTKDGGYILAGSSGEICIS